VSVVAVVVVAVVRDTHCTSVHGCPAKNVPPLRHSWMSKKSTHVPFAKQHAPNSDSVTVTVDVVLDAICPSLVSTVSLQRHRN
jgi:hypothetical protein